jgi:glycerol-3-phosphate dehydrogenase
LLLRRVRLGLLIPDGAVDLLPRIQSAVQVELGWEDTRWNREVSAYTRLWKAAYAPL